jgi:hypothetical protein
VEAALEAGLFLPSFPCRPSPLEGDTVGEPDALHVVFHTVDTIRNVILVDTPDFTSEPARIEGDVALTTLPWFDRLVVMVDHERWFDRQTIGRLREESVRFGQVRFAVFNRSVSGHLPEEQHARLARQASRLESDGHQVLEFRHGRGCPTFPPKTLDTLVQWLNAKPPAREAALRRVLGHAASRVLNENAERHARLASLRGALDKAALGVVPGQAACFESLLTAEERDRLDIISRTLRIRETKEWLAQQGHRIKQAIRRRVPVLGPLLSRDSSGETTGEAPPHADRQTIAWEVFQSRCARQLAVLHETATNSDFWVEIRRWTDLDVPPVSPATIEEQRDAVRARVDKVDEAIKAWTSKVESECRGVSPHVVGAVGATTIAGAIVLVAVSGPVTALTLPAVKIALGNALGTLLASAGAGAVAGRPMTRLLTVIHEKLIGSAEFKAVQAAVDAYREGIAAFGRDASSRFFEQARRLVLPEDDETVQALQRVCDAAEVL